jgi:hypothetical protein
MLESIQDTNTKQTLSTYTRSAKSSEKNSEQIQADKEFNFEDFLDILNPLHHIPIVSEIYKNESDDKISNDAKAVGDIIYGGLTSGLLGVLSAIGNALLKEETNKDLSEHIIDFASGDKTGETTSSSVASHFYEEQIDDPFKSMISYSFNSDSFDFQLIHSQKVVSQEHRSHELSPFQEFEATKIETNHLNNNPWSLRMKQIYGDNFS